MFFAALPTEVAGSGGVGRMPFEERETFLEESGDYYTATLNALTRLEGELERVKNVEESTGPSQAGCRHSRSSGVSTGIERSQYCLLD